MKRHKGRKRTSEEVCSSKDMAVKDGTGRRTEEGISGSKDMTE